MRIEVADGGLAEIEQKIFALEAKASEGMLNEELAQKCIREVRSGLFDLVKLIRAKMLIVNDAAGPGGPDAA